MSNAAIPKKSIAELERKIISARTKLILEKPFLGALVMRLPMKAAGTWCKTTATDARHFYYNPEYIAELRPGELQFTLAHEALHCGLSHFARRGHRNKMRWDVSCDYAINPLLIDEGLTAPPGTLLERSYRDMSAEEIYPYIDENPEVETLDQHVYDQGSSEDGGNPDTPNNDSDAPPPDNAPKNKDQSKPQQKTQPEPEPRESSNSNDQPSDTEETTQAEKQPAESETAEADTQPGENTGQGELAPPPPPLTPQEKEDLQVQWQQRLAGAAQQAIQAGKMGGAMKRMIDHMLQPQLPWRMLLARYVNGLARDDYSYSRPTTRRGGHDSAIFPSLRSTQANLVVAIDISGSVTNKEMGNFLSEVNAIKGQMRARITLLACDARLTEEGPWTFEPWEEFALPQKFLGGGGTNFTPVFKWCEAQDQQPDLLLYFSDGRGTFPPHQPAFPVIWLIKGKEKVPWGQRIQLN
ncbi:MAG: DUF2201 family putative metallopeptidase [bacterium]